MTAWSLVEIANFEARYKIYHVSSAGTYAIDWGKARDKEPEEFREYLRARQILRAEAKR